MALPTSCAVCTRFKPGNLCVANAPSPSTVAHEVAKWPRREPTSVCAQGSADEQTIRCDQCLFWWTPDGQPLAEKSSTRTGFWAVSNDRKEAMKHCVHHTASPGAESVMHYPRETYASNGCGSGKTPQQVMADAAEKG